ncbi:MAG: hypothetical protein ACTSYM_14045 [Candidatus Baldrarchaeia archaeon]
MSDIIWGIGLGRSNAEAEMKKRLKKKNLKKREVPIVELEGIEITESSLKVTIKNIDTPPAKIESIYLWKVLKTPKVTVKKGFLRKKVEVVVREDISRNVNPEFFTVFPESCLHSQ